MKIFQNKQNYCSITVQWLIIEGNGQTEYGVTCMWTYAQKQYSWPKVATNSPFLNSLCIILCNITLFSIFLECFEYKFRIKLWNRKQHEMVITITIIIKTYLSVAIHGKWIIIHPPLIGVDIVLTSLPENLTWQGKGGVGEGGVQGPVMCRLNGKGA